MAKRDAFGREIGEDTLAEVGWKQPPEPQRAQPAPDWIKPKPAPTAFDAGEAWSVRGTPKPEQQAKPQPQQAPAFQTPPLRPMPRRRRSGGFSRLIFALVLMILLAVGAGSFFGLARDAVDSGRNALRDAIPTPITSTPDSNNSGSFLQPAALRKAVNKLPAGRVSILTIRTDGLDATVTAGDKTTLVHMEAGGNTTTVDAPVEIPGKSVKLDPAAPGRIVRTVTRRTGRDADSISQLVLANGSWTVQFADGVQFTANAKGTKVRRIT